MFGSRLKLARKKVGYSLRGLSDALDCIVTAQTLGKYERGEMMPSKSVLTQLTKVLNVSTEYLLSDLVEDLGDVEFRKLSSTSVKEREQVKCEVISCLQRYLSIEEILGLDSGSWDAPRFGNRFLGQEIDGEILAEDLRSEWQLGIEPIPNMTSLLEDKGIKVLVIELPERVSGLTCLVRSARHKKKVPVIVVNRNTTLERRRLTLAHELAHRLIQDSSPVHHEKASNFFAGAFLVPRDHLIREIGKSRKAIGYQELIQLKHMYQISAAALLVRLKQVCVINESTLSYAFQTFARGWRSSEPQPLEQPGEQGQREIPRRFNRLCYWALAEGLISPGRASELLQQPLDKIEQGLRGPTKLYPD